jgi:hypothetical protein
MRNSTKISNLSANVLSNHFDIEEIIYHGRELDLLLLDGKNKFRVVFSNISIFLDTSVFDIWMLWERFRDEVEQSMIFEVPESELQNYLLVAHPNPSSKAQGARVFCVLSKERVLLMLIRTELYLTITAIQ